MKIAHVVRRYTASEWGGTETVVENTLREQMALGHDVRIFCTSALSVAGQETCNCISVERFKYWYPYWPLSDADKLALDKKGGSPYAPALFRAIETWRPDAIHIHAGGRLAAAAVKLAEKLRIPSVYSLHGGAAAVPKAEMDEMLRPLRHTVPYGGVIDRICGLRFDPLARVSAVVCISREEQRRLQSIHGADRIHYLPNGVGVFNPPKNISGRQAGSPLRLLCVSRIDYQKNQLALVDAIPHLIDLEPHLTLVGPITAAWYRDKLLERIRELGLQQRITLIPGLPPHSEQLEAEYAKADVFVLPSVHEPFGIVALEAMAHGIPLVASKVGGLCDFIHDGSNGLFFEPNATDSALQLANAVRRALAPGTAQSLIQEGLKTAADYSWPNIVRQLMELYK